MISEQYADRLAKELVTKLHSEYAFELTREFGRNSIEFLYIKGFALKRRFKERLVGRNFRDLDLLVKKSDFARATLILNGMGFVSIYELGNFAIKIESYFQHAVAFFHPEKKIHLDLHHNIERPSYGISYDVEGVFFRAESIGQEFKIPSLVDSIIICVLSAARDGFCNKNFISDFILLYKELSDAEIFTLKEIIKKNSLEIVFASALCVLRKKENYVCEGFEDIEEFNFKPLPVAIEDSFSFFIFQLKLRKAFVSKLKYILARVFIPTDSDFDNQLDTNLLFVFAKKPFKFFLSTIESLLASFVTKFKTLF